MSANRVQTESAEIVEVIRSVHQYGTGERDDPVRLESRYWTKEGKLIVGMDLNDDPMNPLHPS